MKLSEIDELSGDEARRLLRALVAMELGDDIMERVRRGIDAVVQVQKSAGSYIPPTNALTMPKPMLNDPKPILRFDRDDDGADNVVGAVRLNDQPDLSLEPWALCPVYRNGKIVAFEIRLLP